MADTIRSYSSIALMVTGFVAMSVGADVVSDETLSVALAVLGGLTVIFGGVWAFQTTERQSDYDERYFRITLRGTAVSLWAFYWGVFVLSQLEDNVEVTTPVLEPLTWLLLVPWVAFAGTFWYYTRVM